MKDQGPGGNFHEYMIGTVKCRVSRDAGEVAAAVAARMVEIIREKVTAGENAVLGLATGSTPVLVYQELIRYHREEGVSFQNVHTFNLDEYYGLSSDHAESYRRYMDEQLFSHIDLPAEQAHVPDGLVARDQVATSCKEYEEKIHELGGLDFQLLGIGRTGHIGFNEPGSTVTSRTRLITLDPVTRMDAARDFVGLENVPRAAITMGVGTILEAREIVLMAWGKGKAEVVKRALEERPTEDLPASLMQGHGNLTFALNESAAADLTCIRAPWTEGRVDWGEAMIKKALHTLAHKVGKPILKLVDKDYQLHGMEELLSLHGAAYDLNIGAFKMTQATITGWPGGKPEADDRSRPVPSKPDRKRVVILASEPGPETTALGGTLNRLQKQGHELNLVFLTSGHLTVGKEAVARFQNLLELLASYDGESKLESSTASGLLEFRSKIDQDEAVSQSTKALIRKHQSELATRALGLAGETRHLALPFYEKGKYRSFHLQEEDREILLQTLNDISPHQIYVSGKLSDPSSLEGVCWDLFESTRRSWEDWSTSCQIWLYREYGECWESHEIDMAVPVSPDERALKEAAMLEYPSSLFGDRKGESKQVAENYDRLGLPEYEEIEAFQLYRPELT